MYKRQSGNVALIVVVVLVILGLIGAGIFVWSRQEGKDSTDDSSQKATTEVVARTVEKSTNEVETIVDVDLLLQYPGDESLLPVGTPETFVAYMKTKLHDFDCNFEENSGAGFNITKISPRFVKGGVGCMGGAGTVWYLTTAGWEELGFQSMIPCSTLVELAIPSEFIDSCYDDSKPGEETVSNPNGVMNKD